MPGGRHTISKIEDGQKKCCRVNFSLGTEVSGKRYFVGLVVASPVAWAEKRRKNMAGGFGLFVLSRQVLWRTPLYLFFSSYFSILTFSALPGWPCFVSFVHCMRAPWKVTLSECVSAYLWVFTMHACVCVCICGVPFPHHQTTALFTDTCGLKDDNNN